MSNKSPSDDATDRQYKRDRFALFTAACKQNIGHAVELVRDGADPNFTMSISRDPKETSVVENNVGREAILQKNLPALKELIGLGLDVNLRLGRGNVSLLATAIEAEQESMALLLLKKGAETSWAEATRAREKGLNSVYLTIDKKLTAEEMARRRPKKPDINPSDLKTRKQMTAPRKASFKKNARPD